MKRFYDCIKLKKMNNSLIREAIYRILLENRDECLSINDILNRLSNTHFKNASFNTVYRHLNLFISCGVVITIQDKHKRAYFSIVDEESQTFIVCKRCNRVKKSCINYAKNIEILNSNDHLILHTKCKECREN